MKFLKLTLIFLFTSFTVFAQTGTITGVVIDETNNEPIPFATVGVVDTQIGMNTDIDGKFTITGLNPGFVRLQVFIVGYEKKFSPEILISNTSVPYIEIKMHENRELIEEVVVSVGAFEKSEESPVSMQQIGIKQIESNPGSNRDISRVIQSFPGVGSTPAFRNDIIIRGGGPSENRFFLDEVEIPVLNHFSTQGASGGPVGIINADFIESVDFYSGSFPAAKYNALSGILDFKQKDGSHDKTNLQAALGASESSLTLDGPLGNKTNYIFSVRRSYLQYLFAAIGLPFLPTFNDYQFKLKTDIDRHNKLTIISLGSLDVLTLNTKIENPDVFQEYVLAQIPVNNQWSYTFGTVYKHFEDNSYHTLVFSRNMLANTFYKYPDNNEDADKIFDYYSTEAENKIRYEYTLHGKEIKYTFGAGTEYAKYYNSTFQKVFINNTLTDINYESNLDFMKYGISAQASKKILNKKLLVSLGVRADGTSYNENTANLFKQSSPRLALSYSLKNMTFINAGIGRFFQQAAYTTLGYRDNYGELVNENSAKFIGANHVNIGIEKRFKERILISAEVFYKDYFQYPIDILTGASLANQGAGYSSVAGASPVDFSGKGRASGFEILNRINYSSFSFIGSYTYVRSLFSDINGDLIPSSWDSKHLLTITGSRDLKKNWRVGFRFRFVGGLPYTAYDLEKSANIQAWNARGDVYLDFNKLNQERFKSFHQLDLRVDKNFFFKKWTLMIYFDIQNAYNFQNKGQDIIVREKNSDGSFKTNEDGTEYILNSIENFSGTVLPTLGIMIKI